MGKIPNNQKRRKSHGKNYSQWNITNQDISKQAIDTNAINCWEIPDSSSNSNSELLDKNPGTKDGNMEPSNDEKKYWKSFYRCISLRWVMKSKIIENKPGTKARLCACGLEEEQNYRTDSSTCSREGIRTLFILSASWKWPVNSIKKDLEPTVFMRPSNKAPTNKIWQLKKACMDWLMRPYIIM